ncbi:MAG: type VI secretion protein IcmF/TssM N-terminal domain-containing protein, partial [Gemmataceae bacterium]
IRLYSSSEGIYVTAGSASGWGFFTDALASPNRGSALEGSQNSPDLTKTITVDSVGGGAVDPQIQEEFFYLHREKASRPLSPAEQYRLRELGDLLNQALPTKAKAVQLTPEELTHGPKRLAYLCELIKNERNPVCPINGVLVFIPWKSVENDEVSRSGVPILNEDLLTARKSLGMRYPHYVMIGDLETARGFDAFKAGFPTEMLKQRIGQRLPLVSDRSPAETPTLLENAADWICTNVVSSWVLKSLILETSTDSRRTASFVPTNNARLLQFLHGMTERSPWLGRLLSRGMPSHLPGATARSEDPDSPYLGGCYLAATGRDGRDNPNFAFASGVFQRLTESQSAVAWTTDALQQDARYRSRAMLMYAAAFGILLLTLALGYLLFKKT